MYVFVPSSALVTSANCGYSHNALEIRFPHQPVTLRNKQKAKLVTALVKPYHVLCLSLGGTRAIKYQNKATLVLSLVILSATCVLLV